MKLLQGTHLLLWAAAQPSRLSATARSSVLGDADNALLFSAASLWEIRVKSGLGRDRRAPKKCRNHRGQGRSYKKCRVHAAGSIASP